MNNEVFVSTFRTVLQMLGAILTTKGIVSESDWQMYVGLVMATGSLGWMLYARWNTQKVAADAIVLPPPSEPPAGDGSAQSSGRYLVLPIGLVVALGILLGGCNSPQLETAAERARQVYAATCEAYPAADATFQTIVAILPPGKIPQRVIEAEAAAVAALAALCAKTPENFAEAATAAAKAYADAMKAVAAARAAQAR